MTAPSTYPQRLSVVQYPHPALRKKAAAVTVFDQDLKDFCQRMLDCMYDSNGVGLAAPQVAVSKRIFVTDHLSGSEGESEPRIWINPRLENTGGETTFEEGCLSFPGIYAKVQRFNQVRCVYNTVDGDEEHIDLDVTAGDFLGIVIQHELDHLNGIVFVDHLSQLQLTMIKRKLKDMEKAYKKETGKAGTVLRR